MKKIIRPLFYLGILALTVIAVQKHKSEVVASKQEVKESVLSIWQEKGVPVVTYTVSPQDMTENIYVTLEFCGQNKQHACFYQSTDKAQNLTSGDPVFNVNDGETIGRVSSVGRVNPLTGLVKAYVKLTQKFKESILDKEFSIVSIGVKKLSQVLTVPIASISYNKDSGFVWMYNDGQPEKRSIQIGAQSNDLAEVTSGLKEGDIIVYQGQGMLELYDMAREIKNIKDNRNLKLN